MTQFLSGSKLRLFELSIESTEIGDHNAIIELVRSFRVQNKLSLQGIELPIEILIEALKINT